jgi:uncharacterized Zn finger protein (UPF0148 family)
MTTDRRCPSCGGELLEDGTGACPLCLFRLALEQASQESGESEARPARSEGTADAAAILREAERLISSR